MAKLSSFKAAGSNILEQLAFNCTGDTMSNSFGTTMTAENVTSSQSGQKNLIRIFLIGGV